MPEHLWHKYIAATALLCFCKTTAAINMQTVCSGIGGLWSPWTNSCFKKYTGGMGWTNSYRDCAGRAPDGTRGRLAHVERLEVWNLVKNEGQMWIGMRDIVGNCGNLPSCWVWYEDFNRPASCVKYQPPATILPNDPGQNYMRITGAHYEDAEETRSVDRLCEFVEGLNCMTAYDSCSTPTGGGYWTKVFCDYISWLGVYANDMEAAEPCAGCTLTYCDDSDYQSCATMTGGGLQCLPNGDNDDDVESLIITGPNSGGLQACGANDFLFNGICYMYIDSNDIWEDSFATCRANGAILAGYFDACVHGSILTHVNTKPSPKDFWVSLRGYTGTGYHLDLDKDSCNTIAPTGTITAAITDGSATQNQHHIHYNTGVINYHNIGDPFAVLCMKRDCPTNPCQNGGICFLSDAGDEVCSCPDGYFGSSCQSQGCTPNPCENGGTCAVTGSCGAYTCTCVTGYFGTNCSYSSDECSPDPCVNGVCTDGFNSYNCTCDAGWTGTDCDINIDDCTPDPCVHGTCADGVASYTCTCFAGWNDTNCDVNIDDCSPNPCVHGSCADGIANYTCTCDAGWAGTDCDVNIDDCTPNPCVHGSCTDGVANFTCTCDPGWGGATCNINIDDCTPNPCVHGSCTDGIASYTCTCDAGWAGGNCDVNIDECGSTPCVYGNCTDLVNGYTCDCSPGYTGTLCETDINECSSAPCKNGGQCQDKVNGYKCICTEDFTGVHCETPLDFCVSIDEEEKRKRIAAMAAQNLSSMTLLIMLGVLLGIFLVLLDFSVERIIHIGEELSLFGAHILILLARVPTLADAGVLCIAGTTVPGIDETACCWVAASLHLLFLIHFAFLLWESLHSYTTWTYVVIQKPLLGRILIILISIGVPLIPVGITCGVWFQTYTHDHTCWINYDEPNKFMEVVPVVLMAIVAVIISEATGQGNYKPNESADQQKRISAILSSKGCLIVTLLSFTTFLTGSLAVHLISLSLYSITSILNLVLGGVMIFFHTASNTRARNMFMKLCCCCCKNKQTAAVQPAPAASNATGKAVTSGMG